MTQRFVFNVYELVDDLDAFVVFETMNNRGKKLSNLELLKNCVNFVRIRRNVGWSPARLAVVVPRAWDVKPRPRANARAFLKD